MYKKGFLAEDSSWERTDLFFSSRSTTALDPRTTLRLPASAISRGFAFAARLGHAQSRRCHKFLAMSQESTGQRKLELISWRKRHENIQRNDRRNWNCVFRTQKLPGFDLTRKVINVKERAFPQCPVWFLITNISITVHFFSILTFSNTGVEFSLLRTRSTSRTRSDAQKSLSSTSLRVNPRQESLSDNEMLD